MRSLEDLARPCIRQFSPYVPGKPIEEIRQRFGLDRVIKLASNENPLGPSPRAREAAASSLAEIHRYPEGGSTRLRKAIAAHYGVDARGVIVGGGSDELIELVAKAFVDPGDEIVASERAFIRYRMAGNLMAARVVETAMQDFRHDLRAMARAVTARTKVVFVANPNNPTGTHVTRDEFSAFLAEVPPHVLVAMDEAYFEYARVLPDYPDSLEIQRRGHANILSLRTFSKAYGLAGLRVGYGIGDPVVVGAMDRIRPPFNVTIPSQAACEAALGDGQHVERSVAMNREMKEWLCGELSRGGVEYVPSSTNFVLLRTRAGGQAMFESLLAKGVIVRPMGEYGLPDHLRVSVGMRDEMALFLKHFLALENGAGS